MNRILFLSISLSNISSTRGGFYDDLIKELKKIGYSITCVAPTLKNQNQGFYMEDSIQVLRVKTGAFIGNIPFWKKGVNVLRLSYQYKRAIRQYLDNEKFDIVIMPTPPVTLVDVVSFVKKKYGAKLYLILRDIHPECLDRKVIPQRFLERLDVYDECKQPYGVNPFVYRFLYRKAQQLYKLSDAIGCMSPGNMRYMRQIAPSVPDERIMLLPNWYKGKEKDEITVSGVREKYLLQDKFIAIFGGTIGEAQAVWNIAQLAKMNLSKKDVVFLVVGRGVRKKMLEDMAKRDQLSNMLFLEYMPREDYEAILQTADLGLISIDEKYKVPTSPSKVIGYMALAKPVLAMFNKGNDYGDFYIDKPKCGLWADDLDYKSLQEKFEWLYLHPKERAEMGENGYKYYKEHFTTDVISKLLSEQLTRLALH